MYSSTVPLKMIKLRSSVTFFTLCSVFICLYYNDFVTSPYVITLDFVGSIFKHGLSSGYVCMSNTEMIENATIGKLTPSLISEIH